MDNDPKLEPGAYISGDNQLYQVLWIDTTTDDAVLENCVDDTRRRVATRTITASAYFGQPNRWKLAKAAPKLLTVETLTAGMSAAT